MVKFIDFLLLHYMMSARTSTKFCGISRFCRICQKRTFSPNVLQRSLFKEFADLLSSRTLFINCHCESASDRGGYIDLFQFGCRFAVATAVPFSYRSSPSPALSTALNIRFQSQKQFLSESEIAALMWGVGNVSFTLTASSTANSPSPSHLHSVHPVPSIPQGLAEAHRQNIVHRDIKPANLFVQGRRLVM